MVDHTSQQVVKFVLLSGLVGLSDAQRHLVTPMLLSVAKNCTSALWVDPQDKKVQARELQMIGAV
jgi:hypothetical protein